MARKYKNNAFSALAGAISDTSTTINVTPGTGSRFPDITGDQFFNLTLIEYDGNGKEIDWEIVRVTLKSNDTFTVSRNQEGTSNRAWNSGTVVEHRITAESISTLEDHKNANNNPHTVTKAQVGLGNVDDTSDSDKPVSDATQSALDLKADDDDVRLSNSREWTASIVSQAEAEGGSITTARKWTAERVRQAITAWWNTITGSALRTKAGLGSAATTDSTAYATASQGTKVDSLDGQIKIDGTNVAIGGVSAAQKLQVHGNIQALNVLATSDIRLKEQIESINNLESLNKIENLNPVRFTWKETKKRDTGFIAQEVQEVLPERVLGDDILAVEYAKINIHLVGAVKALNQELFNLKEELEKIKGER